jgi:hypothetical protein
VIATGEVTTLAGTAGSRSSTDGTGAAARFDFPTGITSDGTNLYVVDRYNNTIRKIVIATGEVTTFAGTAYVIDRGPCNYADGTGAAAGFCNPSGITNDGTNLYVAESSRTIRKIVIATGEVTTLARDTGGFSDPTFYWPTDITNDETNLYVSDNAKIMKIVITTGEVTTLAGTGSVGSTDGTGATALFNYPSGITRDGTNLYVADTDNNAIRKISM